jgi:uncharacterized protein (TIGR03437 family)
VTGTNFVNGAKVRVNGSDRTTTVVSATQATAAILASDVTAAGDLSITVFNPSPGGGASNAAVLKVAPLTATTNAASFSQTQMAPESIIAMFGAAMATGTQAATSVPLPTTLLTTTVKVTDSAGVTRDAPLFFVSAGQINFQAPQGTAEGVAKVVVRVNNNIVGAGNMTIAKVGPGIFTANADGTGVPSALVLRVNTLTGAQTYEPVFVFTGGKFQPLQIDMGPTTDTLYLLLFGTGFRNRTVAANITANLGGITHALNSADFEDGFAVGGFVGLDQCNIKMPRTLIGKGVINTFITVDGKNSNTVQIQIK